MNILAYLPIAYISRLSQNTHHIQFNILPVFKGIVKHIPIFACCPLNMKCFLQVPRGWHYLGTFFWKQER